METRRAVHDRRNYTLTDLLHVYAYLMRMREVFDNQVDGMLKGGGGEGDVANTLSSYLCMIVSSRCHNYRTNEVKGTFL